MARHWTHTLVALVGMLTGFLLVGTESAMLAGPVVAASAFAAVFPEFVDAPGRPTA